MTTQPDPIVGYLVHATRREGASNLRIREYLVGLADREEAAAAVVSACPDLDDGYHVESSIGITASNAAKLGLLAGEIRPGAEEKI